MEPLRPVYWIFDHPEFVPLCAMIIIFIAVAYYTFFKGKL